MRERGQHPTNVRHTGVLALGVVLAGCPPPRGAHTQIITPLDAQIARYEQSLARDIPQILTLLSDSDVRLAMRTGAGLSTGAGDPFAFAERAAALEEAEGILAPDEAHPKPEIAADPHMIDVLASQRTLRDLLSSERLRLSREYTGGGLAPRAVVDMLPALVAFLDTGHVDDPDTYLAWRLRGIKDALEPNTISTFEREEIRATLQSISMRGPKAQTELVALQKHLERLPVAPYPLRSETELGEEIEAFVGLPASFDRVSPYLQSAAATLRSQLDVAFGVLDLRAQQEVRRRAAALLAHPPLCTGAAHAMMPAQMAPPDERVRSCAVVRMMSIAQPEGHDAEEIAALLALHEVVVTAGRANAMHERVRDPQAAARKWPRLLALDADSERRELFLAANHPTKAIAAGIAAGMLVADGAAKAHKRAQEWMRHGDARFDVVDPYLVLRVRSAR